MYLYDKTPNILIEHIFTEEEYSHLYNNINNTPQSRISRVADTGYFAIGDPIDEKLDTVILNHLEKITGTKLKKYMAHHARYTKDQSSAPILRPHYDVGLEFATVSLSIVLNTTIDWDIFAEGTKFNAKTNQAVTFSGSHQIHWRPTIEFGDNDYYDIIVCQYMEIDPIPITDEHRRNMENRLMKVLREWELDYIKPHERDK